EANPAGQGQQLLLRDACGVGHWLIFPVATSSVDTRLAPCVIFRLRPSRLETIFTTLPSTCTRRTSLPLARSNSRTAPLLSPPTINLPSGANASAVMSAVKPRIDTRTLFVFTSLMVRVFSVALATTRPSGESTFVG